MTAYYKAIRPDGTDFRTGTVRWAPETGSVVGHEVRHPTSTKIGDDASTYLSVATIPTDCTGMQWPCRLLTVKPIGKAVPVDGMANKRAGIAFRVLGELPAHQVFGPQGETVVALLERAENLTVDEASQLDAAWASAWGVAMGVAEGAVITADMGAARNAANEVAWATARGAARGAVLATLFRDLITPDQYNTLTQPWTTVIGEI